MQRKIDTVHTRLAAHADRLKKTPLKALVESRPSAEQYHAECGGLMADFSKHFIDEALLTEFDALLNAVDFNAQRDAFFSGERINQTENRAVLHTALRRPKTDTLAVDGQNVVVDVHQVLDRVAAFSDAVHAGNICGSTGQKFTHVINIGIGGSDLGPAMAYRALWADQVRGIDVRFVSNIDGTAMTQALSGLNAESTLFVIASKTFTTQETMTNAHTARRWLTDSLGEDCEIGDHFVAVSTNVPKATEFGIRADRVFEFWDWVGGRFSVWSSIGLSLMLGIGSDAFRAMLAGAHEMDRHFHTQPTAQNMPVMMALLGDWYGRYFNATAHAILPYDEGLARFPAFLQQGEMESNGKSVDIFGQPVTHPTCPVVFGEPGTNGQHAFYQLLHQGTHLIPADFILPLKPRHQLAHQHLILASHCFAQTEALMVGRSLEQVKTQQQADGLSREAIEKLAPHKVFQGGRPSTTILLSELTPHTLGALIAAYEHKIFVQGCLWQVFSFDQWGVELGKILAKEIHPMLTGDAASDSRDPSTRFLIERFQSAQSE